MKHKETLLHEIDGTLAHYITGGNGKSYVANEAGIPTLKDKTLTELMDIWERLYNLHLGIPAEGLNDYHYELYAIGAAIAKLRAMSAQTRQKFSAKGVGAISVSDSFWVLRTPGGKSWNVNKILEPRSYLEMLYLMGMVGADLYSVTAVGVINLQQQLLRLGLCQVKVGVLRPEVNYNLLEYLVNEQGGISGGITTIQAIEYLVIPPNVISAKITITGLVDGRCVKKMMTLETIGLAAGLLEQPSEEHRVDLSVDAVNQPGILRLSLGMV